MDLIGRNVVRPIAPEDVDALQALEAAADTLLWGAEANPARWGRRALMMKELVTEP